MIRILYEKLIARFSVGTKARKGETIFNLDGNAFACLNTANQCEILQLFEVFQ